MACNYQKCHAVDRAKWHIEQALKSMEDLPDGIWEDLVKDKLKGALLHLKHLRRGYENE